MKTFQCFLLLFSPLFSCLEACRVFFVSLSGNPLKVSLVGGWHPSCWVLPEPLKLVTQILWGWDMFLNEFFNFFSSISPFSLVRVAFVWLG